MSRALRKPSKKPKDQNELFVEKKNDVCSDFEDGSEDEEKESYNNEIYSIPQDKMKDYSNIELKADFKTRPIFISPDGIIFLETFSHIYRVAYQFLISIGEPIQRPLTMHKFILTKFSLYTAMVLQYEPKDIIDLLNKLCKNKEIPEEVKDYILTNTQNYGSARLFLDDSSYYLDIDEKIWDQVLKNFPLLNTLVSKTEFNFDSIISQNKELKDIQKGLHDFFINHQMEVEAQNSNPSLNKENVQTIEKKKQEGEEEEDEEEDDKEDDEFIKNFILNQNKKRSFKRLQIIGDHFEVTKSIISCSVPLIQEYDFEKNWILSKKLEIDLRAKMKVRYYQEKALKNIFIQQKARSGLIILPCGAGKTVVGVISIARIKQSTVIICDSDVSVDQWKDELERWTTISKNDIVRLTGRVVDDWPNRLTEDPIIIITTYYMMVKKRDNSKTTPKTKKHQFIDSMRERKWGVCIIDEVHKLPAHTFQNVLKQYKFHFKLGLTATPYREDEKINNLFYMIGPKLYEENWFDLVDQGFLAKPYCVEIRCEMSQLWRSEYDKKNKKTGKSYYKGHQKELIHTSNPNKFRVLDYLLKVHEDRGDKILVFCDRPKIIEYYGSILQYPVIHGEVSQDERKTIFNLFKSWQTLFLLDFYLFVAWHSGDTAIDLPKANVGIQIGMHFKSRRQEVQRLGRIMRAKDTHDGQYNAFWYTLISKGTEESKYSLPRQKCLINQGFKFEIIEEKDMPYFKNPDRFKWMTKIQEGDYLLRILMSMESINDSKNNDDDGGGEDPSDFSEDSDSEQNFNIVTKQANPFSNIAIYKETSARIV